MRRRRRRHEDAAPGGEPWNLPSERPPSDVVAVGAPTPRCIRARCRRVRADPLPPAARPMGLPPADRRRPEAGMRPGFVLFACFDVFFVLSFCFS